MNQKPLKPKRALHCSDSCFNIPSTVQIRYLKLKGLKIKGNWETKYG